jgi:hypothetical protein
LRSLSLTHAGHGGPLPLAPADLTVGPSDSLIGLDRFGDRLKLALFVGALCASLEVIGALDQ